MKHITFIVGIMLAMSFTHPFAEQGDVKRDDTVMEERLEKAQENTIQQERAEDAVKEGLKQKQQQEDPLLNQTEDFDQTEGSGEL